MSEFYERGHTEMMEALGLTKVAVPIIQKAPLLRRAGWWLKKKLPQWGTTAKEIAVGRPKQFMEELAKGKAFGKGSLIRQSFHAPGVLNKVFWYGLPAYEGLQIMRSDDPNKAGRMGGLLGGTALGIAAWRPLGIVGSMGAGMLGERIGSGVGQTAEYLAKGQKVPKGRWDIPAAHPAHQLQRSSIPQYPGY